MKRGSNMLKKNGSLLIIILLSIIIWLIFYAKLPAELPVHWHYSGAIDNYAAKLAVFIVTHAILIFLYLLYTFLPKLDPYSNNYRLFTKSYFSIFLALMVTFWLLSMLILYVGLGNVVNMSKAVPTIIGGLFIVLGIFLPQVRRNFFVGMRLPWTLKNEIVWNKTHHLSGKVFLISGIIIVLAAFLLENLIFPVTIGTVVLIVFLPAIYSYIIYRKITK